MLSNARVLAGSGWLGLKDREAYRHARRETDPDVHRACCTGSAARAPVARLVARRPVKPNGMPERLTNQTRGVNKADLPEKICATCGRPFTWRKKWARVWEEIQYCSGRCSRNRKSQTRAPQPPNRLVQRGQKP